MFLSQCALLPNFPEGLGMLGFRFRIEGSRVEGFRGLGFKGFGGLGVLRLGVQGGMFEERVPVISFQLPHFSLVAQSLCRKTRKSIVPSSRYNMEYMWMLL